MITLNLTETQARAVMFATTVWLANSDNPNHAASLFKDQFNEPLISLRGELRLQLNEVVDG